MILTLNVNFGWKLEMKINRDMIDIFLLFGYLNFGSVEFDTGSRIKRVLLWLNLQLN